MSGSTIAKTRLAGLLALLLLLSRPICSLSSSPAAVSCSTVTSKLAPCLPFITDQKANPSEACCAGLKDLHDKLKAKEDREAAYECVKKALANVKYDAARISQVPKKCHIPVTLHAVRPDINGFLNQAGMF